MDELTYLINYLANKDNVREEILKLSREITRDCAMLIRKIHKSNSKDEFENKLKEIAELKMEDLNANDIDAAMRIIAGTARSMGVEVGA